MSLIPEKPLVFFPQLAATLGLEEAIMVQSLKEFIVLGETEAVQGILWATLNIDKLLHVLPFWHEADIHRITSNLREQGILLTDAMHLSRGKPFRYAINEPESTLATPRPTTATQAPIQTPANTYTGARTGNRAQPIPQQWQPESDLLAQLLQYGIPQTFSLEQVGEFVTYWTERNEPRHSWGSRYLKHVLRLWRKQETKAARKSQETTLSEGWQPSLDVFEILTQQANISRNFIEDAIPEFILYWQERGISSNTWNSRFLQHIKRQWASFTHTLQMDSTPRPINDKWQPDETVYEILTMANIDRNFAQNLIPEFIIYWKDSGHLISSWNTKFLQYAKRQWAYVHTQNAHAQNVHTQNLTLNSAGNSANMTTSNHGGQKPHRSNSTRNRDIAEELNDRSWAD